MADGRVTRPPGDKQHSMQRLSKNTDNFYASDQTPPDPLVSQCIISSLPRFPSLNRSGQAPCLSETISNSAFRRFQIIFKSFTVMANDSILYQRVGPKTYHRYKIPTILQPRWTWRYLVCSAAAIYVAYCFIFDMPLFCHKLPEYTGQYHVGALDVEAPLERPRTIHDATFTSTNQPAFELETVLFTLYYPATKAKSHRSRHYWISKPLAATAEGYAKFAHVNNYVVNKILTGCVGVIVGGLKIPAKVDVPLADVKPAVYLSKTRNPQDSEATLVEAETGGYPTIIFTHGMASSRTDYTQWCGEMASRGYVVAAIEHRDGSSPGTVITKPDMSQRRLLHFGVDDVESSTKMDTCTFKKAQIAFRQAEIEETVRVIRAINEGYGNEVFKNNPHNEGKDLHNWATRLNTTDMIISGHSYGATGALDALKPSNIKKCPFSAAIVLDPGKSSGHLNSDITVPILIVHSNSWSSSSSIFEGRPHFDVVYDLTAQNNARGNPSWFMTSLGTSHPSVTDAPLIEPLLLSWTTGARIDVHEGVRQYVHVTDDFMHFLASGERRNLMKEEANYPQYDEKFGFGKNRGQGEGWKRYWQVHVSPEVVKRKRWSI